MVLQFDNRIYGHRLDGIEMDKKFVCVKRYLFRYFIICTINCSAQTVLQFLVEVSQPHSYVPLLLPLLHCDLRLLWIKWHIIQK